MELQIAFGQSVNIERRTPSGPVKGASSIIGAKPPRFLLLDLPVDDRGFMAISPGDRCLIRFLDEGKMIAFWTRIIRHSIDPLPMLYVGYPGDVEEVGVRNQERIHCSIPTTAVLDGVANLPASVVPLHQTAAGVIKPDTPAVLKAVMVDNQLGGAACSRPPLRMWESSVAKALRMKRVGALLPMADASHDRHMRNTTASLQFELPPPAKAGGGQVGACIRWIKRDKDNAYLGVQFTNVDEEFKQDIEATVSRQREFFTRHGNIAF